MEQTNYSYAKKVDFNFNDAIEKVKSQLSNQRFGVLAEIDMKATLKKKIGFEMENYVILEACNPPYSKEALTVETEIGLMLPCNVIVYQKGEDVFVSAILPTVSMGMIENEALLKVAAQIEAKLKLAVDAL